MKQNVCIVVIDAARASNLSCYGHERPTTPNIDAVAEESVIHERAVSPAGATLASVGSLFSGRYPGEHRAGAHGSLLVDDPTLPELFKRQGYQTGAVTTNPFITPGFGFERGIDEFHSVEHRFENGMNVRDFFTDVKHRPAYEIYLRFLIEALDRDFLAHVGNALQFRFDLFTRNDQGAAQATRRAREFLTESPEPWFLYLHYTETHMKNGKHLYKVPEAARYRYVDRENVDPSTVTQHLDRITEYEGQDVHERLYDGALFYVDFYVGRLVDRLKESGQWDDTLFIVTADHGECLGEGGYIGHGTVDEPGVHVPLIVKPAEDMPTPTVDTEKRVNTLGLFNVLANVIGSDHPHGSVRDILTDPEDSVLVQDYSDAWNWSSYAADSSDGQHALYVDEMKFVQRGDESLLYDLRTDPGEQAPIRTDSERVAEFEAALRDRLAQFPATKEAAEQLSVDSGTAKRLEDLGYL